MDWGSDHKVLEPEEMLWIETAKRLSARLGYEVEFSGHCLLDGEIVRWILRRTSTTAGMIGVVNVGRHLEMHRSGRLDEAVGKYAGLVEGGWPLSIRDKGMTAPQEVDQVTKEYDQWAWCNDDRCAHGPFDTRDEAITDATHYDPEIHEVDVGTIEWIRPEDHIRDDLDLFHEFMEESAYDNSGVDPDGNFFFEIDDKETAQKALTELLKGWARKHVSHNYWRLSGDADAVRLPREEN